VLQQLTAQLELNRLPALPQVLSRLLHELNNENLQLRSLSDLIRQDAALAMKVLAVANSSAYKRRSAIESIEQCVNVLGLRLVKVIAMSISLQQFLNEFAGGLSFDFARYWQHSLMVAFLADEVARKTNYPSHEEAYLAGLLHDIGKFALLATRAAQYVELLNAHADDEDLAAHEFSVFGLTHCDAGAALIERWNLGSLIADAIRHHHDSPMQAASATELVRLLLLADAMSSLQLGDHHPALALAHGLFGISSEDAKKLHANAHANLIALAVPLGIQLQDDEALHPLPEKTPPVSTMASQSPTLGEEIRNATMLAVARDVFAAASDEEALLDSILQIANILFEPQQAYLFEWDSASNMLSGRPVGGQPEILSRVRLPLEPDRSLIANALLWDAMTDSFSAEKAAIPSLIDEQIIRMAGAEGIFCMPLGNKRFIFGTLVLAYHAGVLQRLDSNLRFLPTFARQAADVLDSLRNQLRQEAQEQSLRDEAYKLQARKIVHEANNPLAILRNYLTALDFKLAENNSVTRELGILNEEIDRVATIIRKLANPDAVVENSQSRVDVNAMIGDVVAVCDVAILAPAKISISLQLDHELPMIDTDPGSLKQVLVNLFKNAAEAMTQGGVLTVVTAAMISHERGDCITISIKDNGPGIPKEILSGLFSTIKTTKGTSNSGLGLSIVSELISHLGGGISCRSAPGAGTTFDITLPCLRDNPDRHASA